MSRKKQPSAKVVGFIYPDSEGHAILEREDKRLAKEAEAAAKVRSAETVERAAGRAFTFSDLPEFRVICDKFGSA